MYMRGSIDSSRSCAVLTHGLSSQWLYLVRTIPDIGDKFQPLEDIIRQVLIPALICGIPPTTMQHALICLHFQHSS